MGIIVLLIFLAFFAFFVYGLFSIAEGRPGATSRRERRNDARMRRGDVLGRRDRRSGYERGPVRERQPASLARQSTGGTRASDRPSVSALSAMRRADYQGGDDYVSVADIGLLAYRQTDEPKLIRYGDVLLDTNYLRPFIELWLPYQARGSVRFELRDHEGRLRYADEEQYDLVRGRNTLLPGTWLPLQDKLIDPAEWRLRVLAGETLLAVHTFGWQEVGGRAINPYIEADGEISPELQQALNARSREAVSLSDLLSDQDG